MRCRLSLISPRWELATNPANGPGVTGAPVRNTLTAVKKPSNWFTPNCRRPQFSRWNGISGRKPGLNNGRSNSGLPPLGGRLAPSMSGFASKARWSRNSAMPFYSEINMEFLQRHENARSSPMERKSQ